ncbi:DUF2922 domain-containing protein [Clostridium botulinum]|uniref:DUF2922 domain-containing protein n=1 Tax=Clostridium aquiflavi TaxID=3073603 RepID=A0ABU1EKM1_9CLOT|nr:MULTISPECIES: DUF2922 domain-containing protein [Clostridium]MBN1072360.1 DUF2922 domain-containing protein [Clostridium botulinum]MDR5588921.1 DUF2922 domain-containing protein [Clostridium sp. 5N-1]
MEYILSMTFINSTGSKTNINISGVKNDLTDDNVKALMQLIIDKNFFLTSKGSFVKIENAQLTQKEVKKYTVK